jgi:hypothetical protein
MTNSILIQAIENILVIEHYRDSRVRSSEDDITRDYYTLCYNGDKYIQECIENGLRKLRGSIEQSYSFHTVYMYDYDGSALCARTPKQAFYFNLKNIENLKLGLLEICIESYSKDKHLAYRKTEDYAKRRKILNSLTINIINENRSIYTYCNTYGEAFIDNNEKPDMTFNFLVLDDIKDEEKCKIYYKHLYCSEKF